MPLALRGVKTRAASAAVLLRRNLLIYGVGGIVVPFVGIKLIDLLLTIVGSHNGLEAEDTAMQESFARRFSCSRCSRS